MKTKIISIILLIALIISSTGIYTYAVSKGELNSQSNQIDNKISEKEEEIGEVNQKLSASMKEVQDLVSKISSYQSEISELDAKISDISSKIEKAENDITQKQKDLDEKQDLLDKRLVAMYESGNTSYIDLLLSSADISDFISKYYLISEVADYDTNLISTIKVAKGELEKSKSELETNKKTLETNKQEQVSKRQALETVKAEKQKKVATLNSEEKVLEQQLEDLEQDKADITNRLAAIAKQEQEEAERRAAASAAASGNSGESSGGGVSSAPSSSGYIFPVQGLSKANIRNKNYPSYSGHTGVDINIGVVGKSVVAAKSGTVVISEARRNPNGTYRSYGEYIVINHHDGTMTLYAHMLSGSRRVSVNQSVSQGQVIGTVGSTGNSTGTHLHFEVRVNNRPVNPIPYLP